jgi:hypothetical protein
MEMMLLSLSWLNMLVDARSNGSLLSRRLNQTDDGEEDADNDERILLTYFEVFSLCPSIGQISI